MAFEVSSVPLSLTIVFGLPHWSRSRSSSRATRVPEIEVSAMSGQTLARAVVDHYEDAQAAAIDELVGNEVERPAVVRRHWRPCAECTLAPAPPADHEAFFAIDPKQPLVVHDEALSSQQHVQPPVTEASALMGKSPQPIPQFGLRRAA